MQQRWFNQAIGSTRRCYFSRGTIFPNGPMNCPANSHNRGKNLRANSACDTKAPQQLAESTTLEPFPRERLQTELSGLPALKIAKSDQSSLMRAQTKCWLTDHWPNKSHVGRSILLHSSYNRAPIIRTPPDRALLFSLAPESRPLRKAFCTKTTLPVCHNPAMAASAVWVEAGLRTFEVHVSKRA